MHEMEKTLHDEAGGPVLLWWRSGTGHYSGRTELFKTYPLAGCQVEPSGCAWEAAPMKS